ncbi:murein biosynthesis integral membrane protein MurJ [Bacteriovorax sp. PP10]|uniref:Probable lipid II flippase MurJ n=1 Tax=Bacteriovorax antarcticus TaxID=3088717 RepID=A0ABU5VU83_9BACT|nr:murein biosynthesis integral membrane protein MurJ [Bacteriovorax sp. PP10]MEA9356487.1 murein biosynthesis integral membrane protein MurJ [Bacteriovorax sp. PP10]
MKKNENKRSGALFVGLGIFLSRIAGLLRERVFAHYFGNSDAGDAFKAALKIPNFLQNLFGEGVLSASFIPVYAGLLAREHNENTENPHDHLEASKVAMTIGTLMFLMTSLLVIGGIVATPFLIDTIAPGFQGEKRELTIKLVQIFFPGTGLVVMSAWCLGILNSHRRFFLSYAAPIIWNAAILATLLAYGQGTSQYDLAIIAGWGLVLGSFLQVAIQIPTTIKLLKYFRPRLDTKVLHVRIILKNFVPSVISRGVVQVSSYIDNVLASLLQSGAVSNLSYAQLLYTLPISLFGMSISASELPEMSSILGSQEEIYAKLRTRLQNGIQKISFFIIPSIAAFIILGDIVVAALFQTGKFTSQDTRVVWIVLIGSSVGLLASTIGRLYSSTFFSLKDTRTTLNFAVVRIFFTTILGYLFAFKFAPMITSDPAYATAGLTSSAGLSGWIEFMLLKNKLNGIIGKTGVNWRYQSKLWGCALIAAAVGLSIKWFIPSHFLTLPIPRAIIILGVFGVLYFALTYMINIEESQAVINKIKSKVLRK